MEIGGKEIYMFYYPKKFFNYATQGLLPPGSTFKPITAVAGLIEGVVTPDKIMMDNNGTSEHQMNYQNV